MQYTPIRSYRFYDMACFDPVTAVTVGLSAASTAVSAAGTLAGGDAAMASAQRQQQQAEFKAKQEEQAAQQARALAQRAALDKRQEGVMAASRAQAMFAHSGGGAADPTVLNVTGRLSGRNEIDALAAMFKGESEARVGARRRPRRTDSCRPAQSGKLCRLGCQGRELGRPRDEGGAAAGRHCRRGRSWSAV